LYDAAHRDDHLKYISSQLAMLTSTIDGFLSTLAHCGFQTTADVAKYMQLSGLPTAGVSGLNAKAPSFTPAHNATPLQGDTQVTPSSGICEQYRSACQAVAANISERRESRRRPDQESCAQSCKDLKATQVTATAATSAPALVWEPLDPWLFFDRVELGRLSQSSSKLYNLVDENTPFLSWRQEVSKECCPSPAAEEDPHVVTVTWHGDSLCMDNVIDHFRQYGECECIDWGGQGDYNVVPLRFESESASRMARDRGMHTVLNDRGRGICVATE